ncbi:MAG: hypothetical protein PHU85_02000 [Phycisphaerae bacterium]|nr:hypothetical protein [Phycisphaerae bacterium]
MSRITKRTRKEFSVQEPCGEIIAWVDCQAYGDGVSIDSHLGATLSWQQVERLIAWLRQAKESAASLPSMNAANSPKTQTLAAASGATREGEEK